MHASTLFPRRAAALLLVLSAACSRGENRPADTTAAARDTAAAAHRAGFDSIGAVVGLETPECARWDSARGRWLVANINGAPSAKDGNGFISTVRADGTLDSLRFIAGGRGGVTLNGPKGMAIVGDTVWVADIDAVRGFLATTGAPVATVDLRRSGAVFLNDIAVAPDGSLYVTDTGLRIGGSGAAHPGPDRIFRVAPDRKVSVALQGASLNGPNGIAWDRANGRFLVASYTGKDLLAFKPGDSSVTVVASGPGQFDGLAVLRDGRVLVTSWADSSLHVFTDGAFSRARGGLESPGAIGVDSREGIVAVPLLGPGRVIALSIPAR